MELEDIVNRIVWEVGCEIGEKEEHLFPEFLS